MNRVQIVKMIYWVFLEIVAKYFLEIYGFFEDPRENAI